jgi:hypothetical protein
MMVLLSCDVGRLTCQWLHLQCPRGYVPCLWRLVSLLSYICQWLIILYHVYWFRFYCTMYMDTFTMPVPIKIICHCRPRYAKTLMWWTSILTFKTSASTTLANTINTALNVFIDPGNMGLDIKIKYICASYTGIWAKHYLVGSQFEFKDGLYQVRTRDMYKCDCQSKMTAVLTFNKWRHWFSDAVRHDVFKNI